EAALELLALLRRHCGDRVTAFELLSRNSLDLVLRHIPGTRDPLSRQYDWYVLAELSDSRTGDALRDELERALEAAMEAELVADAVIGENEAQSRALWRLRETIPEAARGEAEMLYRHDISVAVSRIPAFIREARTALLARFPGANIICFGHLGDGNLHYNAFVPGRNRADTAAREASDVTTLVYDVVHRYEGSFSAEHGVGLAKINDMVRYKDPVELQLMVALKRTLDPHGIMNPGKVLELPRQSVS
ncbi:MAG TPA: FAD-linked oxidase C-terminal domain-containing protein, partial [Burkholderiales bacterium]|nr:FAD-linked oxidase C-terminal domain-containing protein [Burkholderiales bacterium]